MKLLILGASDSEGKLLPNFSDAWREILRVELPPLLGEELEIEHRRYYVHLPGALEFLERCISEAKPDFVIIAVTAHAFATPSVGNRLRRVLGKRAGSWFERQFSSFDRATDAPEGTMRDRMNSLGHAAGGRVIGRRGLSTYDQVLGTYTKTVERLARIEDLDLVVMGATYIGPAIERRLPELRAKVDRFNEELEAFVLARHFAWVDRQSIVAALPGVPDRPDQMHTGKETHRAYAGALLPLIVERMRR